MLTIYRYVTRDPPSVGQTPRHCCSHLRGSSPQVHRRKTQNYPDAETGRQWKRNVMIAQHHRLNRHASSLCHLCYLKSLTFYIHDIYLYVYTVYGWMWLSLTLYIMFNFFFFSFMFSLNKYSRLSFHLRYVLCKALTWKCIYSMLENWYIVINNKRVVCFHKLRSHTKVYCCLIPYVTRASGYKTTEVYYMIKLVM